MTFFKYSQQNTIIIGAKKQWLQQQEIKIRIDNYDINDWGTTIINLNSK